MLSIEERLDRIEFLMGIKCPLKKLKLTAKQIKTKRDECCMGLDLAVKELVKEYYEKCEDETQR